jgi:hypothetical protein
MCNLKNLATERGWLAHNGGYFRGGGEGYHYVVIAAGWSEGAVNRTAAEFQDYTLRVAEEFNSPLNLLSAKLETRRSGGAP